MVFNAWQRELLEQCRVARLGTIAADGRPHLVPVCYALVGEAIAIAIDEKPKQHTRLARLRNIGRDPRVTLLVDRYSDDWTELAWLRVDGRAEVIERGSTWPEALAALRARYLPYRVMNLEGLPLIVVRGERLAEWRWQGAGE